MNVGTSNNDSVYCSIDGDFYLKKSYIVSDVLALGNFDGLTLFNHNHLANWFNEGHLRDH